MPNNQDVETWLGRISDYDQEFEKWVNRVEKIEDRFKDKNRKSEDTCKYNILWSNVQTLTAATFAKIPKPDVSRRFMDQDPIGRIAALILERSLDFEVQKYNTYAATLKSCVQDRFLGGRGSAWVRYEPHFKAAQSGQPEDGLEVTEDIDEPDEELDYECAPCDYVHWRDFGHVVSRTWEEVPAVWRKVYLTRDQCTERFGEDVGKTIPLDARPEDEKKNKQGIEIVGDSSRALIYEIWDKTTKEAIWLSKSLGSILDRKKDPLGLDDFFPCPKPMFATLTNDSLIPVPDFFLYQDQANELDILCDRIDGLVKALKVVGAYDASLGTDFARIFTEGSNNNLLPIKDWAAFAEKKGLSGAVDIVDITPIVGALRESYTAMEQIKQQIYDITGISDIIRGQTNASETATAQQIKGQYASLRLKSYQDDVARFASDLLRIQSQIICKQFSPQTIVTISAADQLPEFKDQQLFSQAIDLLTQEGPNPTRMFRIEVSADSMIQLDEQQEKEDRIEFLSSISQFMNSVAPLAQAQPALTPMISELIKFGVRGFKVGKSVESAIEMSMQAIQQNPAPDQGQMEQKQKEMEEQAKQIQDGMGQIEQGKQFLLDQHNKLKEVQQQIEQQKLELERQGVEIDKKGVDLEKKAIDLGFREESHNLDKEFTKSSEELKKQAEGASKLKEEAATEATLSESAKRLAEISQEHMNLSVESMKQINDGIQMLIQTIEAANKPKKRQAKISKDPKTGIWTAEDVPTNID